MTSIIYVGMDVHTTNFTFCCYTADSDRGFAVAQTEPDYRQVIKYMERVQKQRGEECKFVCGYEAGCLGYSLYHQLTRCGVDCVILAPSTMHQEKGKRIKTDRRDAENIARRLAFSLYSPVYVPTTEDDAVKEYLMLVPERHFPAIRNVLPVQGVRDGLIGSPGVIERKDHTDGPLLLRRDFQRAVLNLIPV